MVNGIQENRNENELNVAPNANAIEEGDGNPNGMEVPENVNGGNNNAIPHVRMANAIFNFSDEFLDGRIDGDPELVEILFTGLQNLIQAGTSTTVYTERNKAAESLLFTIAQRNFNPRKQVKAVFTDETGMREEGVDFGGPRKELFRLSVAQLSNSTLFEGTEKSKFLNYDSARLACGDYRKTGTSFVLSIVQGQVWPRFLSTSLYWRIAGKPRDDLKIEDVGDEVLQNQIRQIRQAESVDEVNAILVTSEILSILGFGHLSSLEKAEERIEGNSSTISLYILSHLHFFSLGQMILRHLRNPSGHPL